MTHIFDGKAFAKDKEELIRDQVNRLIKKGIRPKLVSILVGEDPASVLYVNLKKRAAERIGAEVEVISLSLSSSISVKEIQKTIEQFNNDNNVHGIMVQLPLPWNFSGKDRDEIINAIAKEKDVDGLRGDSPYAHPTAKAVLEVLEYAKNVSKPSLKEEDLRIAVVGASGMVGRPLLREFKRKGIDAVGYNTKTINWQERIKEKDVVISATGVPDLIKESMVRDGVVLIDVGSPNGDIEKRTYEKASFISPVPGGVGPVTVSCLLENLVEAAFLKI